MSIMIGKTFECQAGNMLTKYDKFFFLTIIVLPFIDILTTFTVNLPLSIGAIVRTAFMFFLFVYLFRYYFQINYNYFIIFLAPFICITVSFLINFLLKNPFSLTNEIQFLLKTAYFIVMIFTAITIIEQRNIQIEAILRATSIASIIVALSYWIAIFTKTNIPSYTFIKTGYSGWFYSANELSVIVIILLALAVVQFHLHPSWQAVIAYSLLLSMTPMIGTKTAFYGGIIIAFSYIIFSLFTFRHKMNIALVAITVLFIVFLPQTPVITNKSMSNEALEQIEPTKNDAKMQQMLSSRDVYLKETKKAYFAAPLLRKLFGLGYAGDYGKHPKTIEMDFYELFFSYGIIGAVVLLFPLLLVSKKILTFYWSLPYFLLLLTCALCVGIAFVAGHVLFAPAVMSYVAILAIVTGLITSERSAMYRGKF